MSDEPGHPPSFQFYPRDFVSSRSVRLMSPLARGGYVMLLCHAWMSEEPGVLEDEELSLAALSELGEQWPACASMIRRAFRATSREGRKVLVQDRLVKERQAQLKRFALASQGGRARAATAIRSPAGIQQGHQRPGSFAPPLASASASASASAESQKKKRPRARKPRAPAPQLSLEALAEKFDLPLAKVKANAAKISASGKYRNEYRTLINWCANDAADGNGKLPRSAKDEERDYYESAPFYGSPEDIRIREEGRRRDEAAFAADLKRRGLV